MGYYEYAITKRSDIYTKNSQVVKKRVWPYSEKPGGKRCEIKHSGQEMALIIVQWQNDNLVSSPSGHTNLSLLKIFAIATMSWLPPLISPGFLRSHTFFTTWLFLYRFAQETMAELFTS